MVKDVVDPVLDERLAEFVVSSHMRAHPHSEESQQPATAATDPDVLPQEMLRKYVTYAKQTCRPRLQNADYDKIATVSLYPSIRALALSVVKGIVNHRPWLSFILACIYYIQWSRHVMPCSVTK